MMMRYLWCSLFILLSACQKPDLSRQTGTLENTHAHLLDENNELLDEITHIVYEKGKRPGEVTQMMLAQSLMNLRRKHELFIKYDGSGLEEEKVSLYIKEFRSLLIDSEVESVDETLIPVYERLQGLMKNREEPFTSYFILLNIAEMERKALEEIQICIGIPDCFFC